MKNPTLGLCVTHFGRKGFIETVGDAVYVVVRFPSSDGFPFPTQEVVRVKDLKRFKKPSAADLEPALF